MAKSAEIRLRHMLEAAQEAVAFVQAGARNDLDGDRMLSLALVKLIETIGEATNSISPAIRVAFPQNPWHEIIGMHHRLIHGYYEIDLDIVWEVISNDLPPLINQLKKILAD